MSTVTDYLFSQAKSAELSKQGGWKAGDYVASVLSLTYELRLRGKKGQETPIRGIWVDVVVDESSEGASPKGSRESILVNTEGANTRYSAKDLGYLAMAVTGLPQAEALDKFQAMVDFVNDEGKHSNPANPARGIQLGFQTREHKNKEGKVRYYPSRFEYAKQTPEEIATNRARLDDIDAKAKAGK